MFSKKERLAERTGEFGIGRYEFLKQLIKEFAETPSYENKRQTLANLANFAYDPINYNFIKQLHLIDLFLAELSNEQEELIHFALAGICNLCADPESRDYIIALNGVKLISEFLLHEDEEISLNALTSLYYMYESEHIEVSENLKHTLQKYKLSSNPRLRNLGTVFLETATHITRRFSNTISKLKSFKIGDEVTISRNITKEDIDNFTLLSGDTNPIHSADGQGLGVVHGAFLNCIVSSVIGTRLPGPGTIVVHQDLNFPNKCYIGETVNVTVKLVEDRKIMKVDFKCDVVERQKTVLYGSAKLLMSKLLISK
ncbi:uncharacterized protein [Diabrotica undecimpunctata]|uniref:uncharacterized protein n=1 Tax=Diabrotica undecimpunctata TaxID=50387 RepID=UPI003B63E68A